MDSGAIALAPLLLLPQYMYNSFGNDFFSTKMLVATLSYTENVAKAILHSFRLLRILDCHKDGVNMYQFCVNPEDNPECFEPAA